MNICHVHVKCLQKYEIYPIYVLILSDDKKLCINVNNKNNVVACFQQRLLISSDDDFPFSTDSHRLV